jgi:hypothetical protein
MSSILLSIPSHRRQRFFSTSAKRASEVAFLRLEKRAFASSWLSISLLKNEIRASQLSRTVFGDEHNFVDN